MKLRIFLISILSSVLSFLPFLASAQDYDYSGSDAAAAGAATGIIGVVLIFWLLFIAVAIGFFIFWIIMLVDAFKRTNWQDDNQKNLWLIILIVSIFVGLAWLAAILYYIVVKRELDKKAVATPATQPAADKPSTDKK